MRRAVSITLLLIAPFSNALAEGGAKTLAATLEIYVFPTEGQAADQQSKDEAECYSFASEQTGVDPFGLEKEVEAAEEQAEQQVAATQDATQGAGARGAVRGAAAGAIIGEVTGGDAGESAAIGAAAVGISSRRRTRAANAQAADQAEETVAQAEQHTEEQLDNFNKAFSVCLEAKDYLVKY